MKATPLELTANAKREVTHQMAETPQEYRAESSTDFYSIASNDEGTFNIDSNGHAQAFVLHVDGRDLELKRVP